MREPTHLTLVRYGYTPKGTFGRLYGREHQWFTVERPWEHNTPYISCIPEGEYGIRPCVWHKRDMPAYELFGDCMPGRSLIKIHPANKALELNGCIALGKRLGDNWDVLDSREAHKEFMGLMDGREGTLTIERLVAGVLPSPPV